VIERAIAGKRGCQVRVVVADKKEGCSEKISNLLTAVADAPPDTKVFAFADSDARVGREWLTALTAPLEEEGVGAVTGYRWHVSERFGFWAGLLAAWNGAIATTLGDHRRNFVWGGSAAINKDTFDRIGVAGRWAHAASDDYALTRAVQDACLYVRFQPRCLVATYENPRLSELLEFTTRQVTITRVYRPRVWWAGFISHLLFVAGSFVGVAAAVLRPNSWIPIFVGAIYLLGSLKGLLRLLAATEALPDERRRLVRFWWMYCLLWPLVSVLFIYNFALSAFTRCITWRGVRYELRSPTETIILE
jgi:cellulose synthase/poly-beta-1,6-N-acetylglucosamine synthase-like glycosyltransferase